MLLRVIDDKGPSDRVWTSPTGAKLNNGHFHSRGWIPAMETLRIERGWTARPRFHDLRHTAASFMLGSRIELHRVSKILGHSMATCEKVYGHISDSAAVDATSAIGEQIAGMFAPLPTVGPDGNGLTPIAGGDYEDEPIADVSDLDAMRLRRAG
jgi:hypothetical protein